MWLVNVFEQVEIFDRHICRKKPKEAMSNFDFLHSYDAELAEHGGFAEKDLYGNPKGCANDLRIVGEGLTKLIVVEKQIYVPSDRNAKPGQGGSTFDANLKALQSAGILRGRILSNFHQVRTIGNKGSHPGTTVPVQEAKLCLEAAYRIAVWYVRDFKRDCQPIPGFVLPEPDKPEPQRVEIDWGNKAKSLLDTPTKRWIAGVLSAFGLMWILEIYRDPEHRWHVALGKVGRLAVVLLVIALLLLPAMVFAHGLSLWQVYKYFAGSLEQKLGWNQYLVQSLVLVCLLPFLYAVKMFASPLNSRKRMRGTILLVAFAIAYNLMFYYATRGAIFSPDGHNIKYYARTDQGIVLFDRPGFDPATGQPLMPVTPEIARQWSIQTSGSGASVVAVDPAKVDWFNHNTGKPMLWYYRFPNGELAFYSQPGNDPQTGDPLTPVTKDLYLSWRSAQDAQNHPGHQGSAVPSADLMSAFRKTLSAGAGGGAPGVLLLQHPGTDREATDALSRHLAGVNTNALHAEALERQGYASRLYHGDENLLREAISVTRLASLVVADVSAQCAKKSSLDADLLTCDLTANARKFDAHGNPVGTMMARGTGAGFNQTDALELAAQHASAELMTLAKR